MTDLPIRPSPSADSPRAHSSSTTGVNIQGFPDDPTFAAGLDKNAQLQHENDHLRRILGTQPVIEQAKGVLMQRFSIEAEMAFKLLTRWSQAMEQRLSVVAEVLLELAQLTEIHAANAELVRQLEKQLGHEWSR